MLQLLIVIFYLFCTLLHSAPAQDWNQWRGPKRSGIASVRLPAALPARLQQVWSVEVGEGYSSPIIVEQRVYLISRQGEDEVIAAYDLATGKQIWKDSYAAPYTMNPAAIPHGKGPKSTPLHADKRLFTFGITGVLSAYDVASGKLLWQNDFKKEFPVTSPDFGTAMSPALENGMLLVHAGGPGKGAFFAIDASTGKAKWRWDGDGPAYASPVVVSIGGMRQIVTQTQQNIVSLSFNDGKLLWKMPFVTEYEQNAVTPVLYKDLLIFSGINKGIFGVKITHKNAAWMPETVWKNERAAMYLSSPVLIGDFLYGITHFRKGQFFCLNAATGETLWTSTGGEGENASITSAGNFLFFLNDDAELTVVKATEKKYEPVQKYEVAKSPTWAHPAISGKGFVIKDLKFLSYWTW